MCPCVSRPLISLQEVEFALGPFAVTDQREKDVDFSMAVMTDNQAIITKRPTLEQDMGGFLRPFTLQVCVAVRRRVLRKGIHAHTI